jgi:hypothetical protein
MANADVNVTASIQRLSDRNGMVGVGVHLQLQNTGTVKVHFMGVAVNVFGQRVVARGSHAGPEVHPLRYEFSGFYHAQPRVTVFSYAYLTHLGDPASQQDTELDPGTTIENFRAFYVPKGRFDLLTVGVDAPYTKYDDQTIPTQLVVSPQGSARIVTTLTPKVEQYNITPVSSLDVR